MSGGKRSDAASEGGGGVAGDTLADGHAHLCEIPAGHGSATRRESDPIAQNQESTAL